MTGLTFLIPVALGLGLLGLVAFFWALRSGQFDDLDGAAARILIEDDEPHRQAPAPVLTTPLTTPPAAQDVSGAQIGAQIGAGAGVDRGGDRAA